MFNLVCKMEFHGDDGMVSVRSAKSKGSQFEYDCQYSLSGIWENIFRTSERGFQLQYDLECDDAVFECKRLKGMSWNQAVKFFEKLERVKPENKMCALLFRSNQQPCLVMGRDELNHIIVMTFEDWFGTSFDKHPSTRSKK